MQRVLSVLAVFGSLFFAWPTTDATAAPPSTSKQCRSYAVRANGGGPGSWNVPDLCKAYSFPTKLQGGAVIGILEFGGGYLTSDLTQFSSQFMNGTPINIQAIPVDGGTNSPGNDGASGEVTLDIEVLAGTYYYCTGKAPTIKVFFAPNSTSEFVPVIQAAVAAGCDVLSISWGLEENFVSLSDAQAIDAAAAAAAAQGMAIFAATGDGDSNETKDGESDSKNHIQLPSCCPNIIAVGGTSKTLTTETVWNDGSAKFGSPPTGPWGTGGGYSTLFPIQSFQIGAPLAPTSNNGKGRMVPDVSANADILTPYNIVFGGSIVGFGGTSASAPLWAGLIASSSKKPANNPKLGSNLNSALWLTKNRADFVDITSGNNGLFTAAVGPDACSGIGVPIGTSISALFGSAGTPPKTASTVTANYNSTTKTLTLTGDTNSNSLTVTYVPGSLTIQGANQTNIVGTGNNLVGTGASAPSQKFNLTGTITTVTSNLLGGNDAIAFVGVDATNMNITNGTGQDSIALSLCGVTTLKVTGYISGDTLLVTSSSIGTKTVTP